MKNSLMALIKKYLDAIEKDKEEADRLIPIKASELKYLIDYIECTDEQYARIMSEDCPTDEIHCTCVPVLKMKLKEKEAECKDLRDQIQKIKG